MPLRYIFIQVFYTADINGIEACNLCIKFELSRSRCTVRIGLKFQLLMVEIKGIFILCIWKNCGNQENTGVGASRIE